MSPIIYSVLRGASAWLRVMLIGTVGVVSYLGFRGPLGGNDQWQ